jgi:hypothetical protein
MEGRGKGRANHHSRSVEIVVLALCLPVKGRGNIWLLHIHLDAKLSSVVPRSCDQNIGFGRHDLTRFAICHGQL